MAQGAAPGPVRLLARALARRCPWCGRGRLFRGWFRIVERCPRCGLRFEREEGAFLGAMALNYGVAGVVFMAVLIGWMVIDSPDVPVVPLVVTSMSVTGAVVLLFYPFSKTLWAGVDVLLNRMDRRGRGDLPGAPPVGPIETEPPESEDSSGSERFVHRRHGGRNISAGSCHSFSSLFRPCHRPGSPR